ncbi:HK97 gp10 family phage protein [Methylobacterium isbiliense]|nr:HK97 gp10 family phage protein [Methylobacterium isbiliense]
MTAVFRESAQRVIAEAQKPVAQGGRMRVDTGFLRASGTASLNGLPPATRDRPGEGTFVYNPAAAALVIAGAGIGDTIHFGWTASYARHREYGTSSQAPDAFMRTAAQQWPAIVARVSGELQSRSLSGGATPGR